MVNVGVIEFGSEGGAPTNPIRPWICYVSVECEDPSPNELVAKSFVNWGRALWCCYVNLNVSTRQIVVSANF